jgi:hypothetical protein
VTVCCYASQTRQCHRPAQVSEELGWSLLAPWAQAKGWTGDQRTAFLNEHKWTIIGFAAPFALLNGIPFVGGFAGSVAEGAVAHLVYTVLAPPRAGAKPTPIAGEAAAVEEVSAPTRLPLLLLLMRPRLPPPPRTRRS